MVQLDGVWKMTDKELIELAAKAYGFGDPEGNFIWTESEYPRGQKTNGALWNYMGWCDTAQLWNPLTDDGDALRLAVRLGLGILFGQYAPLDVYSVYISKVEGGDELAVGCITDGDEFGVVRRAITRAAALIGKEME